MDKFVVFANGSEADKLDSKRRSAVVLTHSALVRSNL